MTASPKLSRFELQIMEALWTGGPLPIREIQQSFEATRRPAYTTVQTMVYRLEAKGVVQRVKKIGNAHIFGPLISRVLAGTQNRVILRARRGLPGAASAAVPASPDSA